MWWVDRRSRHSEKSVDFKEASAAKNEDRIRVLEQQIIIMQTQVSPLWASVQARISSDLHHPDPQFHEMDLLLEKLDNLTINANERARLIILLGERAISTDPLVTQKQRDSASIMVIIMKKVVAEAKAMNEITPMVFCPPTK